MYLLQSKHNSLIILIVSTQDYYYYDKETNVNYKCRKEVLINMNTYHENVMLFYSNEMTDESKVSSL